MLRKGRVVLMYEMDYAYVEQVLIDWLQDKVREAGAEGVVIGLSGGIDSSVTSLLCKKAFGDNVLGVILPCYSKGEDEADARLLAEKFAIRYLIKDLGGIYDSVLTTLDSDQTDSAARMATANIKPRLRMTVLYYYAALNNYLVVGTDNWSEFKVGYFTKYGDGGVDIAPMGRLVKTEVRQLARYLGVPERIIEKAPSAGLWQGQTDEEEMGFSYEALDHYILTGEANPETKDKIERLARKSAHKTQAIPIPARQILIKS